MSEKKIDWKDTLNLPKTQFPMKAQLNRKEPEILQKWESINLYQQILDHRDVSKSYILHDGPPYANGKIHLGHALNKILKDFIVKTKSMEGYYAPYVPGWDCHGLPIEINIDKQLGPRKKDMTIPEIRLKCKEYAEKYLKIQREDFKRLGILGEWENPYTTFDPEYEATIISFFKSFVQSNNVVRKKRPVYWCNSCRTALAEAEVEYGNHTSPSIYVKFQLKDLPEIFNPYKDRDIYVLIWTTTPWTIPANLAIALHPEFDYSLFEMNGELYIAASRLIPLLADMLDTTFSKLIEFKGSDLSGYHCTHPLYDRDSLLITTDYVELESGTGCVHTAPGHGEDDYRAGLEYKLDIYSPVDSHGRFDETTGKYNGKEIFSTNREIIEDLKANHRLIHQQDISHSYPHCWRCKKPLIFRATAQWFISMDTADLRQRAIAEIKKAKWLPAWGEERITSMIANRPDWCISRQRDWGVPIPVFFCQDCEEPILDLDVIDNIEKLFREHGSDAWYTREVTELLPPGLACSNCGSTKLKKGMDILDVWFESGASFGILDHYTNHRFPADMYLEGGDQYRGWFHSSLLVGISAKGAAPYRTVITNGWALDQEGRAMSKSLGNVIPPQTIINDKGAEILRLWVAMVNYKEDIRLGNEILSRVTESYRKIRNTWRFMLGVLADFNPADHSIPHEDLSETDRYILYRLHQLKTKIFQAYNDYEYHTIFHNLSNFFTNDLSAFYLNIMKDNLYCNAIDSRARRASQATIFRLLVETLQLAAPILSFTSEEAWEHLPAFSGKTESVHLQLFPEIQKRYTQGIDVEKWERLSALRTRILKEIEDARNEKKIGDSMEAVVSMECPVELYQFILSNRKLLVEILVVSEIKVSEGNEERITISRSLGNKCPRCWNWFTSDTSQNRYPELCERCSKLIEELPIENQG